MTNEEAYKFGFLLRCADETLDPRATLNRVKAACVVKQACTKQATIPGLNDFVSGVKGIGSGVMQAGALSLLGGSIAGAAGGYGLAALEDERGSPEEEKNRQRAAALAFYTKQLRANQMAQDLSKALAKRKVDYSMGMGRHA